MGRRPHDVGRVEIRATRCSLWRFFGAVYKVEGSGQPHDLRRRRSSTPAPVWTRLSSRSSREPGTWSDPGPVIVDPRHLFRVWTRLFGGRRGSAVRRAVRSGHLLRARAPANLLPVEVVQFLIEKLQKTLSNVAFLAPWWRRRRRVEPGAFARQGRAGASAGRPLACGRRQSRRLPMNVENYGRHLSAWGWRCASGCMATGRPLAVFPTSAGTSGSSSGRGRLRRSATTSKRARSRSSASTPLRLSLVQGGPRSARPLLPAEPERRVHRARGRAVHPGPLPASRDRHHHHRRLFGADDALNSLLKHSEPVLPLRGDVGGLRSAQLHGRRRRRQLRPQQPLRLRAEPVRPLVPEDLPTARSTWAPGTVPEDSGPATGCPGSCGRAGSRIGRPMGTGWGP